jgi:hypothetical protein
LIPKNSASGSLSMYTCFMDPGKGGRDWIPYIVNSEEIHSEVPMISTPIHILYIGKWMVLYQFLSRRTTHPDMRPARSTNVEPYCIGGQCLSHIFTPCEATRLLETTLL